MELGFKPRQPILQCNAHVLRECPWTEGLPVLRVGGLQHSEGPLLWQELYLGWDGGGVVLKEKALETVNPQPLLFLVLGLGVG